MIDYIKAISCYLEEDDLYSCKAHTQKETLEGMKLDVINLRPVNSILITKSSSYETQIHPFHHDHSILSILTIVFDKPVGKCNIKEEVLECG